MLRNMGIQLVELIKKNTSAQFRLTLSSQLDGLSRRLVSKEAGVDNKVSILIKKSIIAAENHEYDTAETLLLQAARLCPENSQISPHLSLVRYLRFRSLDVNARESKNEMLKTIDQMNRELKIKEIYVPGSFWSTVGIYHLDLLERYGIENFKRTVSHHYQNWLMVSSDDEQVVQLHKLWAIHQSIKPWFTTIEVPDNVGYSYTQDFSDPVYPLSINKNREIYRVSVGMLWEYVKSIDKYQFLEKISESEIGNPIRIKSDGQMISSDIAHSVRERNLLLDSLSLSGEEELIVGELGAGHGRLAEVFGKTTNYKHFIFDITPALYVSQWYIKKMFPDEKIFQFRPFDNFEDIRQEIEGCRYAFFTSNQIEKIPAEYFDLFINLNSLAEMAPVQINNFITQIHRVTSTAFLSRQQLDNFNPIEKVRLVKSSYKMPDGWTLRLDNIDEIHPIYFNQIWEKFEKST